MREGGYLLTEEDHERVGRIIGRGEFDLFGQPAPIGTRIPQGTISHVLQIQAGAANSFGYPARVQQWSDSAGTWSDFDTTEVRVEDPNGQTLSSTQYVVARALGLNSSAVMCYALSGLIGLTVDDTAHAAPELVSNTFRITFAPLSAVTISEPSAGTALVTLDDATGLEPGIVSVGSQYLGSGPKKFHAVQVTGGSGGPGIAPSTVLWVHQEELYGTTNLAFLRGDYDTLMAQYPFVVLPTSSLNARMLRLTRYHETGTQCSLDIGSYDYSPISTSNQFTYANLGLWQIAQQTYEARTSIAYTVLGPNAAFLMGAHLDFVSYVTNSSSVGTINGLETTGGFIARRLVRDLAFPSQGQNGDGVGFAVLEHGSGLAPVLYRGQDGFTGGLRFKNGLFVGGQSTGVSDGDKGDVLVSGGGATWTVQSVHGGTW